MVIPLRMRALVKREARRGIWMEEVPVPVLGRGEVLVRVGYTAICGTDLHIYKWDAWSAHHVGLPRVIGHEFVGRVVALGEGVGEDYLGERVSGEGHVVCGACRACGEGRGEHCPNTVGVGLQRDGAFAEFVVLPVGNLWRVPEGVVDKVAAFLDPLGNALHCVDAFQVGGEAVLITGAGPIGILAAGLCRFLGAWCVVISDRNVYRLALAKRLGAHVCVNVEEESVGLVSERLGLKGVYAVGLEMSGSLGALDDLTSNLATGGQIALLGILPDRGGVNWDKVIFNSLTLKGIYGRQMYRTWYRATQLLLAGFKAEDALTHLLPIESFQEGFDLMEAGLCGKVVCDWGVNF